MTGPSEEPHLGRAGDGPFAAIACYGAVKQFHKGDDGSHNVLLIVTANGPRLLVDIVSSALLPLPLWPAMGGQFSPIVTFNA